MSRLLFPATNFHAPSEAPTSPQILTYVSDGDTNGVFYFLGTNYGVAGWVNPYTATRLGISSLDNTGGDNKATIVDRAPSQYSTGVSPNHIIFDLGVGNALIIDYYSYRYRDNETTFCPTAWTVEGSNDGLDWSHVVDTVTGETSALDKWVSRPIIGETLGYRYWRFQMTGNNNSGTTQASIGEFEIYGEFSF